MASRIVPGGRDSRRTCVRVRAAAAPALPVRSHRPHLAAPPPPARPTPPKAGGHAPEGAGEYVETSLHISRTGGTCDRALAELQHPGPPCPRPQPGALGRGDRLLLDQSVTRSWSSRLRRRQEDRRHQTPHCRGHPGLLVAVLVTAASVQDRAAVPRLLGRARYRCPRLGHLRAEQGYTGSVVQAVSRIVRFTIQIVGGIKLKGGFITQPRRWVIERTFAWMQRCRRLTRQYEQTPLAHEAMVVISQLALILRRLDRMTEPPP